jgi:methylated-DNA-[protein]-cysteine S-methyltransferase
MKYVYKFIDSPVGRLKLVGNDDGLAAVLWDDDPRRVRLEATQEDDGHPVLVEAQRQLGEYFAGTRRSFSVRLNFVGTEFQKKVWAALLEIPLGETVSYAELARRIGAPKAARAVGAANGKNPIAIIGPCHRVIGSSGGLTDFAGGLAVKQTLLELERRRRERPD